MKKRQLAIDERCVLIIGGRNGPYLVRRPAVSGGAPGAAGVKSADSRAVAKLGQPPVWRHRQPGDHAVRTRSDGGTEPAEAG